MSGVRPHGGGGGTGVLAGASTPFEIERRSLVLPSVAVLCVGRRGSAVASAIALALAHACGRPFALAASVGAAPAPTSSLVPSSARAAAQLRRSGLPAHARGRLVWLADRRSADDGDDVAVGGGVGASPQSDPSHAAGPSSRSAVAARLPSDPAGAAAALSSELGRAAAAVQAPAALAIPFARSAQLDRVLAWHDAVVVVRSSDSTAALLQLILASVAALDRPVVAVPPPGRLAAAASTAGMHVPAFATSAVAQLGFGEGPR